MVPRSTPLAEGFLLYFMPGGYTLGETPLPIPNREVKPQKADGTVLVTARESRTLPGFFVFPFS